MRLVFLGTPKFAAEVLKKLIASRHEVVAVVTQPDRPNQRGNKIEPSEVKTEALRQALPVHQFQKIRADGVETLKNLDADVFVTAAYGQILSDEILNIAPYGVLNVHASLLPKYRGSSPVQWAIAKGERTVGVTIMKTARQVDSGDILLQKAIALEGNENTDEVLALLSPIGAEAIIEALDNIEKGSVSYTKQDETQMTHFPMLKKEDGKLLFSQSAEELKNLIRAMNPWPCAFCTSEAGTIKVYRAEVAENDAVGNIGEVVAIDTKKGILVQTGKGVLLLTEVQGEGGKRMAATAYAAGRKCRVGEILR